ncbi:MAG: hypothetical protein KKE24_08135 [Candidatus Thermoplasmatota archaeon]|nr:hypothetical protein [Candidatus Thermoplasmatota archaeon]
MSSLETSMHVTFAVVPILAIGIVLGIVLLVIGLSRRNSAIIGYGETLFGLTVFAFPMVFFLDKVSDDWEAFVPSTGDIALLGILSFVGGMSVALGLRNILSRTSVSKFSTL